MKTYAYTIEEIKAAIEKAGLHSYIFNDVKHELTKKPTFEVGQVVSQRREDINRNCHFKWQEYHIGKPLNNLRPLNQTECGPYVQAIHNLILNKRGCILYESDVDTVLSQMPEGWDE